VEGGFQPPGAQATPYPKIRAALDRPTEYACDSLRRAAYRRAEAALWRAA